MGKRMMVAVLVVVALSAAAYGAAAALNVDGGTVQAGDDRSLRCDTDGVETEWKTMTSHGEFRVIGIEVRNIDEACEGYDVMVALWDSNDPQAGNQIGFFRDPDGVSGGVAKAYEIYDGGWTDALGTGGVSAEEVRQVDVLIKRDFTDFDAP